MAPILPHPIGRDGESRSRLLSSWVETGGKGPESRRQAEKHRKSAGRLLTVKKRITKNIQPRTRQPSELPERSVRTSRLKSSAKRESSIREKNIGYDD